MKNDWPSVVSAKSYRQPRFPKIRAMHIAHIISHAHCTQLLPRKVKRYTASLRRATVWTQWFSLKPGQFAEEGVAKLKTQGEEITLLESFIITSSLLRQTANR